MQMPQFGILTQYVKDFSFENPNAPRSLAPSTQPPQIGINIAVEATPLGETEFEVTLRLEGKGESQGMVLFGFELLYAGIFRIDRLPAAVVPVRARDRRHGDAQWRFSAAAAGTGRFRRAVSPAHGRGTARAGRAQSKLT
jgi:hypothetical protein